MRLSTRSLIAALLGLSGLLVMATIIVTQFHGIVLPEVLALLAAALFGATAAGFATAPLFGRPGRKGAALALVGALIATLGGAALGGGAFGAPRHILDGLAFGPIFVAESIATYPAVAAVWITTMALTHLLAQRLREKADRG